MTKEIVTLHTLNANLYHGNSHFITSDIFVIKHVFLINLLKSSLKYFLSSFCISTQWRIQDFPLGGGGADLRHVHFPAKKYVKTKEMDPVGGGAAPVAPPGSANATPGRVSPYPVRTEGLVYHQAIFPWHVFTTFLSRGFSRFIYIFKLTIEDNLPM